MRRLRDIFTGRNDAVSGTSDTSAALKPPIEEAASEETDAEKEGRWRETGVWVGNDLPSSLSKTLGSARELTPEEVAAMFGRSTPPREVAHVLTFTDGEQMIDTLMLLQDGEIEARGEIHVLPASAAKDLLIALLVSNGIAADAVSLLNDLNVIVIEAPPEARDQLEALTVGNGGSYDRSLHL